MATDAEEFVEYVNKSPSPYHAVHTSIEMLEEHGFERIYEDEEWNGQLEDGGKYYVSRFGTSLIAFTLGDKFSKSSEGFLVIGAHTDSPCFKLKPVSSLRKAGYVQVGVETYGGGLWYSWFDRDLTVAGRLVVENSDGGLETKLVHVPKPLMHIASLAIHLNREANSNFSPNTEAHTAPIIATEIKAALAKDKEPGERHSPLLLKVLAEQVGCKPEAIKDLDLCVVDTQPAAIGGACNEFVFSPRLDNLASCFVSLKSLTARAGTSDSAQVVVLFDHEEIGSSSAQGAESPFLMDTIFRISEVCRPGLGLPPVLARSFIISADMAHAVHPNYTNKHEENHRPALNKGVVIKTNQKQRYATNGYTGFMLREIARREEVPVQEFVVPNDLPCGSTIGPIVASGTGIRTVDVGIPQLAMHSCREMCCGEDFTHAIALFTAFFEQFVSIDQALRRSFA